MSNLNKLTNDCEDCEESNTLNKIIYFNVPIGDIGVTYNYISDKIIIPAYGYQILLDNLPTNLYGNNLGLGLTINSNFEINKTTFIQFNICNLIKKVKFNTIPTITIKEIKENSGFSIYGSNTLGVLGTVLFASTIFTSSQTTPIPQFGFYKYISIIAELKKPKTEQKQSSKPKLVF